MSTKDLIEFVANDDENVSKVALEHLLQFTPSSANQTFLFEDNDFKGLRAIKKLSVQSTDSLVIQNALIALINLSDSVKTREELASDRVALQKYAKYITTTPKLPFVKYACMLLTNLGREADTLKALEHGSVAALMLTTAKPENVVDEDFDFLAFAFSEFSRQGASKIAKSIPFLYPQLVIFKDKPHASLNRRKGISATIKNALFDTNLHEPLGFDTPLVETLLICLKGPEEMDKEDYDQLPPMVIKQHEAGALREPDTEVQYTFMECLLLLSGSQTGRDVLRLKNAYFVVRELHLATEDHDLKMICEKFVDMVMRGDPTEPNQEEDEEDKIVEVA